MAVKKNTSWKWVFPGCFTSQRNGALPERRTARPHASAPLPSTTSRRISLSDLSDPNSPRLTISDLSSSVIGSKLHAFTLSELRLITRNFTVSNLVGEGGFGPVYKGFIDENLRPRLTAQPVAVKVLDLDGTQGHREWLAEVVFLGQLKHPHLVNLIGYCCEDEQRILVYEFMARGNLENHLFRKYSVAVPWCNRMKIAAQTAEGLAFLHEEDKPVIYRDFKASNILLDSDFTAKLSDFGLAKDGPDGDETHVSTRIMGTNGYAAPEYIRTGHLTMMSDVYSFGVVLLELMTGRRSVDKKRPSREQCLVDWAAPLLKDPRKVDLVMDPRLEGQYSMEGARRAAALALRCLSQRPKCRPTMSMAVDALRPLVELRDEPRAFVYVVPNGGEPSRDDAVRRSPVRAEEGEKQRKAGDRDGQRKGRRCLRSRAVYSDSALYRSPLNGTNPTKQPTRRASLMPELGAGLTGTEQPQG